MSTINSIEAIQIIDSRGTPSISCKIVLENGIYSTSMVPSGASTGSREALELRDEDDAYFGKGVKKAIANSADKGASGLYSFLLNAEDIEAMLSTPEAITIKVTAKICCSPESI